MPFVGIVLLLFRFPGIPRIPHLSHPCRTPVASLSHPCSTPPKSPVTSLHHPCLRPCPVQTLCRSFKAMLVQLQDGASPRAGGTAAAPASPLHRSSLAGTAAPASPLHRSSLAGTTAAAAGSASPSSPHHRSSLVGTAAAIGTAAASFPGGIRPGRGAAAASASGPGVGDGTRVQPWWVAAGFSAAPAMLKRYADLLREREEVRERGDRRGCGVTEPAFP